MFAFTPQANFPTDILNLIESRLPFKIFSTLFVLKIQEFPYLSFVFNLRDGASHQTCKYCLQSGFKTPAMEQKEKKSITYELMGYIFIICNVCKESNSM